jgi:hypothetical protein
MWEEIRDSAAYAQGFVKIKDVIMGMENTFQQFEVEVKKMKPE